MESEAPEELLALANPTAPVPPDPERDSAVVTNDTEGRLVSCLTHHHAAPSVTLCISDLAQGTCMDADLTGEAALTLGRALMAGGLYTYHREQEEGLRK